MFQCGFKRCNTKNITWQQLIAHAKTHRTRNDFAKYYDEMKYELNLEICSNYNNIISPGETCDCIEEIAAHDEEEDILGHGIDENEQQITNTQQCHILQLIQSITSNNVPNEHPSDIPLVPNNNDIQCPTTKIQPTQRSKSPHLLCSSINTPLHNKDLNNSQQQLDEDQSSLMECDHIENVSNSLQSRETDPTHTQIHNNSNNNTNLTEYNVGTQNMDCDTLDTATNINQMQCVSCDKKIDICYNREQLKYIKLQCSNHRKDGKDELL